MNITKEQADKVIAALSMNRIMARDENGNYTKEITAQVVVEALSIMRGLAEDAEPVGWKLVPIEPTNEMISAYLKANTAYWERTDALPNHPSKWRNGTPQEATAEGYRAMLAAATSPQAAQTEAALCEMVRLSEDAGLYDSDFQAGRAGSKP